MNPDFLLDSSACIPVLRNKAGTDKLPAPGRTGIPAIVAAELWTGVRKNITTHPHQAPRLQAFLGLFQLVDFNLDAALHYADIRAELEAAGLSIGPLDLLIAAQARSIGATLVTANAGEFKRVKGLKLLPCRFT
ncbi:MAG: PIN domain-containing protein [Verrucomicrobiota bacterium]